MGKGIITSVISDGEYTIIPDYDMTRLETEIEVLALTIADFDAIVFAEMDAEMAAYDVEIADWADNIAQVDAELELLDPFDPTQKAEWDAYMVDKNDYTREMFKAMQAREVIETKKKLAEIHKKAAEKKKEKLETLKDKLELPVNVWKADRVDNLLVDDVVGTVEVPNELFGNDIQIRPSYGGASWDSERDGQLAPLLGQSPSGTFYNLAMLAGKQKYKPQYRYGTITFISQYDSGADHTQTATVTLATDHSSQQAININQRSTLYLVPADYMDCDMGAFTVGDEVLIEFYDRDETDPWIIGFKDHPKRCEKRIFAIITLDLYKRMKDALADPEEDRSPTGLPTAESVGKVAFAWDVTKNAMAPLPIAQPCQLGELETAIEEWFDLSDIEELAVSNPPTLFERTDLYSTECPWEDWLEPHNLISNTDGSDSGKVGPEGESVRVVAYGEWENPSKASLGSRNLWPDALSYQRIMSGPGSDSGRNFPDSDWQVWWHYGDVPYDDETMYHFNAYKYGDGWPELASINGGMSRWKDTKAILNTGPDLESYIGTHYYDVTPDNVMTFEKDNYVTSGGSASFDYEYEEPHDQYWWWFGAKFWSWPMYKEPRDPQVIDLGKCYDCEKHYSAFGNWTANIKSLHCGHRESDWSRPQWWGKQNNSTDEFFDPIVDSELWLGNGKPSHSYYLVGYQLGGAVPKVRGYPHGSWAGNDGPFGVYCHADDTERIFQIRFVGSAEVTKSEWKWKGHYKVVHAGMNVATFQISRWWSHLWERECAFEYKMWCDADGGSPLSTSSMFLNYTNSTSLQFTQENNTEAENARPGWSDNTTDLLVRPGYGDIECPQFNITRHRAEFWAHSKGYWLDYDQDGTHAAKVQIGFSVVAQGIGTISWNDKDAWGYWNNRNPPGSVYPAQQGWVATSYELTPTDYYVEAVSWMSDGGPEDMSSINPFSTGRTNSELAALVKNLAAYAHQTYGDNQTIPGGDYLHTSTTSWWYLLWYRFKPVWDMKLYEIDKNRAW